MRIKVFKAPTMKDAMANVKAELGDDAVILHTKRYKKGGLMGFRTKEIVEIIAAVEDQAPGERVNIATAGKNSEAKVDISSPAGGIEDYQDGEVAVPPPVRPPRGILNQYKTAGTAQQVAKVEKAQQKDAKATTIADLMELIRKQEADESKSKESPAATDKNSAKPVSKNEPPVPAEEMTASERDMYYYPMPDDEDYPLPVYEDYLPPSDDDYYGDSEQPDVNLLPAIEKEPEQPVKQEFTEEPEKEHEPEKEPEKVSKNTDGKDNVKVFENNENAKLKGIVEKAAKQTPKPVQAEVSVKDSRDDEILHLQEELVKMKAMLSHAMSGEMKESKIVNLQAALKQNEVEDRVIQDMISRLTGAEIVAEKSSAKAKNALENYLRKTIRVAKGITLYSDRPKVVALVGATGVGKTTTLAKIAAKFVLEKGVSTAMITADTYRISAVEQLKTYSDIIGLPLEIVYSPDALKKAIKKHASKQLILIDTAGRSQYNEFQMKELCELLEVDKNIEKHLVMSATTKNRDAEAILEHFSVCRPDRIIFTKTDETSSIGIIPNLLHKKKIALSYLTDGQSVPDDIYPASIEKLAELLLR